MLRRLLLAALLGSATLTLTMPPQASATTMLYASTEELTSISDTIVEAVVLSSRTYMADSGNISTDWTIEVREAWRGAPPQTLTFTQFGGELDGRVLYVPGDARFEVGEEVVLFLRTVEGRYYLSAMGQSKFIIDRGTQVTEPVIPDVGELSPSWTEGIVRLNPEHVEPVAAPELGTAPEPVVRRDLSHLNFYNGEVLHLGTLEVVTLGDLRSAVEAAVAAEVTP